MTDRTLTVKMVKTVDVNDLGGELWSGARERWEDADDDTREAVFERVCDWTDGDEVEVDMTTVNDLIWFECDDLFFPEDDEEDTEDEEDEDEEDEEDDEDDEDDEDEETVVDREYTIKSNGEIIWEE